MDTSDSMKPGLTYVTMTRHGSLTAATLIYEKCLLPEKSFG